MCAALFYRAPGARRARAVVILDGMPEGLDAQAHSCMLISAATGSATGLERPCRVVLLTAGSGCCPEGYGASWRYCVQRPRFGLLSLTSESRLVPQSCCS